MKRQAERVARLSIGSIFLLIGVIGGFIPVLQGWFFIVMGLTIMAPESRRARRALDWAKSKVKRGESNETDKVDRIDNDEQR